MCVICIHTQAQLSLLSQPLPPDLDLGVEMPEHVVDLVLETSRQHFVGLVQHKLLDVVRPDKSAGKYYCKR